MRLPRRVMRPYLAAALLSLAACASGQVVTPTAHEAPRAEMPYRNCVKEGVDVAHAISALDVTSVSDLIFLPGGVVTSERLLDSVHYFADAYAITYGADRIKAYERMHRGDCVITEPDIAAFGIWLARTLERERKRVP